MTIRWNWQVLLGTLALICMLTGVGNAGDRHLSVVLVDMTPDEFSSRSCVKQLQKVIAADYSEITRMTETRARKLAGKPTKGEPFLDWSAGLLDEIKAHESNYHDTAVLVDCRPEKKSIDILVSPPSSGVARIEMRRIELNKATIKWLGKSVLRRAWQGFSP